MDHLLLTAKTVFLIIIFWAPGNYAFVKKWLPTVEWNDPTQWSTGRLPCEQEIVIFPDSEIFSMTVDSDMMWSSLILPQSGEVVLHTPNDVTTAASGKNSCKSGENKFLGGQTKSWFDPRNWRIGDESELNLGVPHAQHIPCAVDDIVFPPLSRSVNIDLHYHTIHARSTKFGDVVFSAENLTDWFLQDGSYHLKNPNNTKFIKINQGCDDPLGCICENEHDPRVMQLVCGNSAALCHSGYTCETTVRPKGNCCGICGAVMSLEIIKERFTLAGLQGLISDLKASRAIDVFASRVAGNIVQVVITDRNDARMSHEFADQLQTYLLQDIPNENIYGLTGVHVQKSSLAFLAAQSWSASQKAWAANITLFIFVFILIGLLAALAFVYKKNRSRGAPEVGFVRFENDGLQANVDVELSPSGEEAASDVSHNDNVGHVDRSPPTATTPVTSAPGELVTSSEEMLWKKPWQRIRAFANPLFGNPLAASGFSVSSLLRLAKDANGTENPTYDAMQFGDSSVSGKTQVPPSKGEPTGEGEPNSNADKQDCEGELEATVEQVNEEGCQSDETVFQDVNLGDDRTEDDQGLILPDVPGSKNVTQKHPILQVSKRMASNFRKLLKKPDVSNSPGVVNTAVSMQSVSEEERDVQGMNDGSEPVDPTTTAKLDVSVGVPDITMDVNLEHFLEDDEKRLTTTDSE